uniref:Uncharacterized protein n=1 Tax=Helianthus annuus TaxID=4232 RepID=A0A251UJR6_HELAN
MISSFIDRDTELIHDLADCRLVFGATRHTKVDWKMIQAKNGIIVFVATRHREVDWKRFKVKRA